MSLSDLETLIDDKSATLGVIGLGYVGLPVACVFAQAGFSVVGVDVKQDRVAEIAAGVCPIEGKEPGLAELLAQQVRTGRLQATTDYETLRKCDVVILSVETPIDADHRPDYGALRSALRSLGSVMRRGALVVVESTIAPGTMDSLVQPMLEASSGMRAGEGFYLGHCPERVMPGKLLRNLRSVSRVCGGDTPEVARTMIALYRHIVEADLDPADCVTAELVKTAENAYRDVNIAFANEVAMICEAVGGDVWAVRELVNKSPGRNMLMPGAGVGGHCIPKDPWLLAAPAREQGVPLRLIPAARAVNDGMPLHVARLLEGALAEVGKQVEGARILVLGYAYLENTDEVRNSPSAALVEMLQARGAEVLIHDPYVALYQGEVDQMAQGCDALVVMVKHEAYRDLSFDSLQVPVVVDGRRAFSSPPRGVVYRLVGRGDTAL